MNMAEEPSSTPRIKLLNIGESKSGKTGSLVSLAEAGFRLWILDYDHGLSILRNLCSPEAKARITYESPRDKIKMQNGVARFKSATAYKAAGRVLEEWNLEALTPQDIVVIDTLTTLSSAAFNEALLLSGRLNARPQLQDYGWMADSVYVLLQNLTDDSCHFHLIVNTHIRYFASNDEDQTLPRGLPNAKGQELCRTVSNLFNTVILTRSEGSGRAMRRMISTVPQGVIEVATEAPNKVKPSYPVEGGLAPLFRDILGEENMPTTTTRKDA